MKNSNYFNWFRRLIVLGAVVAAATASTATAGVMIDAGGPIDVQGPTALGLKADGLRLTGIAQVYQQLRQPAAPDVFERYAASHPYGVAATAAPGSERIVDDWFRDPTPIATPAGDRIVDDYFRDAPTVVASPTTGNGLDWGDFGIGAGAMFGLAALVIGLGLGAMAVRHRTGRLGTS